MKILGIDPGYDLLGWSVIDDSLKVYDFGVIKTSKSEPEEIRLLAIHKGLISIIERFQPNCLSIEKLFSKIQRQQSLCQKQLELQWLLQP